MKLGSGGYTYSIRPPDPYRTAGTAPQSLGLGDPCDGGAA